MHILANVVNLSCIVRGSMLKQAYVSLSASQLEFTVGTEF